MDSKCLPGHLEARGALGGRIVIVSCWCVSIPGVMIELSSNRQEIAPLPTVETSWSLGKSGWATPCLGWPHPSPVPAHLPLLKPPGLELSSCLCLPKRGDDRCEPPCPLRESAFLSSNGMGAVAAFWALLWGRLPGWGLLGHLFPLLV